MLELEELSFGGELTLSLTSGAGRTFQLPELFRPTCNFQFQNRSYVLVSRPCASGWNGPALKRN